MGSLAPWYVDTSLVDRRKTRLCRYYVVEVEYVGMVVDILFLNLNISIYYYIIIEYLLY